MSNEKLSPLLDHCYKHDFKNLDKGLVEYYKTAIKQDNSFWKNLLIRDWQYRASCRMNVILQLHGNQGTGKSMVAIQCALNLGRIFKNQWSIEDTVFRWEDTRLKASNSTHGQTILTDEQQLSNYGTGSDMLMQNISDLEDQMRRNQINFIYCSPERRRHSNFFELKTLDVFPREQDGYPKSLNAMLYVKRHMDSEFLPRAIIEFNPPPREIMETYDKIKGEHLDNLKSNRRDKLGTVEQDAQEIFKNHKKEILVRNSKGLMKIAKYERIMWAIFKEIGDGKYTNQGYKYLYDRIKVLAEKELGR